MRNNILDNLILQLSKLPGITKKMAEKIAYHIIGKDSWYIEDIEDALKKARTMLKNCSICGNVSSEDVCDICNDKTRQKKLIIVGSVTDILKFENQKGIRAYYHVLSGLVSLSKKIDIDQIEMEPIYKRLKDFKEVIIALSPNLEGIITANYINKMLKEKIKVTQLAQGIPLGAAMEYVDELTLKAAIENRKVVK